MTGAKQVAVLVFDPTPVAAIAAFFTDRLIRHTSPSLTEGDEGAMGKRSEPEQPENQQCGKFDAKPQTNPTFSSLPCFTGYRSHWWFPQNFGQPNAQPPLMPWKLADHCLPVSLVVRVSDLPPHLLENERRSSHLSISTGWRINNPRLGGLRLRDVLTIAIVVLMVGVPSVFAHGGGLDANGCHNDRKRGGYHCHRGSGAAATSPRTADRPKRIAGTVYFANCSAARAAGAAPVRIGDPGYARHLDRDGDGVGCE